VTPGALPFRENRETDMDKALMITGASSGIGRATALAAAEQGWKFC